ncbi:hypothetical protein [Polynucleobacter paneuropaeus]|uniref:hypothetical protein n=1 Tax=Polynucleobacter paneuropaeus TaxID=2527775 RepID=UPI0011B93E04|nr:hypothetical protein [Polynucleobacter paneuropaeus]
MTKHGRSWLSETGGYLDLINDRIAAEVKKGMTRGSSSYLSYLTLGELQTLIFRDFWQNSFANIFDGKKSLQKELLERVMPVRNKIAHFRPVTKAEYLGLNVADDFFNILKRHYQATSHTLFYLSGDPQNAGELLDSMTLSEAQASLKSFGCEPLLEVFFGLQWLRAYGMSPGMGVFKNNLFIELYFDKNYSSDTLRNWVEKKEYEVTIATFSDLPKVVRIFVPLVLDAKVIAKTIEAFANTAKESCQGDDFNNQPVGPKEVASEIFIDKSDGKNLSFAF